MDDNILLNFRNFELNLKKIQIIIHNLKDLKFEKNNFKNFKLLNSITINENLTSITNTSDKDDDNYEYDYDSFNDLLSNYSTEAINIYKTIDNLVSLIAYKLLCIDTNEGENDDGEEDEDGYIFAKYSFQLTDLKERYEDLKIEFRKAQLISKKNHEMFINQLRDDSIKLELYNNSNKKDTEIDAKIVSDNDSGKKLSTKLAFNEKILDKNEKISNSLQNSRNLLQASIIQSELNIDNLETSTKNLSSISDKFEYFNSILNLTNGLVKKINENNDKEKNNIYRALYFFFGCCAWIIWRRLLNKPIRLLIWVFYKSIVLVIYGTRKTVPELDSSVLSSSAMLASTLISETIKEIVSETLSIESVSDIETDTQITTTSILNSAIETASSFINDEL
ncbi:unnamed protein product [[Candida] boidinii]|uniref:Unnamed protein product n=1 Tax=Candida boidinii TaxID=5477 RepID=A0A9W6WEY0_CANBO|nr:hypothetical protein B5S30_g2183 [[Candida] boidinii]OWB83520.1 hypothetical protein B5S33_g2151 [[Candida] boidinii]GME67996.1 unnamed protein product [[Candida] boidinii]GMF98981.1 unnamed protein product [[Candida] boidinii]